MKNKRNKKTRRGGIAKKKPTKNEEQEEQEVPMTRVRRRVRFPSTYGRTCHWFIIKQNV